MSTTATPSKETSDGSLPPSAKRFKPDYSDDLISLLVGADEEKFVVHKATLCQHSTFFVAACAREWKEGKDRVVRIPENEPEVFDVYVHWAYTKALDMTLMTEPPSDRDSQFAPPSYLNLAKVWILANFLGNDLLCNVVIDRLLTKLDGLPRHKIVPSSLQYIFEKMSEGSKFRRLVLDVMAARMTGNCFKSNGAEYPQAGGFDMARRFAHGLSPQLPGPTYQERCKYHEHGEEEQHCG